MITLSGGTFSVTLPNPILGDSEQYLLKTDYQISYSWLVHSTVKTIVNSKLLMKFESLTATQKENLEEFITAASGLPIIYTDYLLKTWMGILTNEPFEFIHIGKNECEEIWSIMLEFEALNT